MYQKILMSTKIIQDPILATFENKVQNTCKSDLNLHEYYGARTLRAVPGPFSRVSDRSQVILRPRFCKSLDARARLGRVVQTHI